MAVLRPSFVTYLALLEDACTKFSLARKTLKDGTPDVVYTESTASYMESTASYTESTASGRAAVAGAMSAWQALRAQWPNMMAGLDEVRAILGPPPHWAASVSKACDAVADETTMAACGMLSLSTWLVGQALPPIDAERQGAHSDEAAARGRGSDADGDADGAAAGVADGVADGDADMNPNADRDADKDPNADGDADMDPNADSDADEDPNADGDADMDPNANRDADEDPNADGDATGARSDKEDARSSTEDADEVAEVAEGHADGTGIADDEAPVINTAVVRGAVRQFQDAVAQILAAMTNTGRDAEVCTLSWCSEAGGVPRAAPPAQPT